MNRDNTYNQQQNRLSTLPDDNAICLDYVKQLVQNLTGKSVKSIVPKEVYGADANYTGDNKCFYAINLTIFPTNLCPLVTNPVLVKTSDTLFSFSFTAPTGPLSYDVTLLKDGAVISSQNISTNTGTFAIPKNNLPTKIGALVSPNSIGITVLNNLALRRYRIGTVLGVTTPTTLYQAYQTAGFLGQLSVNYYATDGTNGFFTDMTTYNSKLDAYLSTALSYGGFELICFENEENNKSYRVVDSSAKAAYITLLTNGVAKAHQYGAKAANGGLTGPSLYAMVYNDLVAQGRTADATAFRNATFETTDYTAVTNNTYNSRAANQPVADMIDYVLANLKSTGADYCNFHYYFSPLNTQPATVDTFPFIYIKQYVEKRSGLPAICNETGVYNSYANYPPAILQLLTACGMDFAYWYDGTYSGGGTGSVAVNDTTTGALTASGIALRDEYARMQVASGNFKINVTSNCPTARSLGIDSNIINIPVVPAGACPNVTGLTLTQTGPTQLTAAWTAPPAGFYQSFTLNIYLNNVLYDKKVVNPGAASSYVFDVNASGAYSIAIITQCSGADFSTGAISSTVNITLACPLVKNPILSNDVSLNLIVAIDAYSITTNVDKVQVQIVQNGSVIYDQLKTIASFPVNTGVVLQAGFTYYANVRTSCLDASTSAYTRSNYIQSCPLPTGGLAYTMFNDAGTANLCYYSWSAPSGAVDYRMDYYKFASQYQSFDHISNAGNFGGTGVSWDSSANLQVRTHCANMDSPGLYTIPVLKGYFLNARASINNQFLSVTVRDGGLPGAFNAPFATLINLHYTWDSPDGTLRGQLAYQQLSLTAGTSNVYLALSGRVVTSIAIDSLSIRQSGNYIYIFNNQ